MSIRRPSTSPTRSTRPIPTSLLLGFTLIGCAAEPASPPDVETAPKHSYSPVPQPMPFAPAPAPRAPAMPTVVPAPMPPPPPAPPDASQLRRELQRLCWGLRVEYDQGLQSGPIYRVTARFENPSNPLHSDVATAESSDYESALRMLMSEVRSVLGKGSFSGGPDVPFAEESMRQRLEAACWSYRIDYHNSDGMTSYDVLGRAHAPKELSGSRSTTTSSPSLESAIQSALDQLQD